MSKQLSTQKKLEKIRAPRVQLTYEVERGDAIEAKELPFVVGVLGDFAGQSASKAKLRDRHFVNVDLDNFDDVMEGLAPSASFTVPNELEGAGTFPVSLTFHGIDDFRPESVVRQVEPLRRLIEARERLADLRNKMNGSDLLEDMLIDVLATTRERAAGNPAHEEEV